MLKLESENEEPQRNVKVEELSYKVVIGPDDDDPPPEPPPKPKPQGLFEWLAGLCRRRRVSPLAAHRKSIYAPIAAFSRTAK